VISHPDNVRIAFRQDERALYDLMWDYWKYQDNGTGFPFSPDVITRFIERGTRPDPSTRTDQGDQLRVIHGVAEDPEEKGRLLAAISVCIESPVWYTAEVATIERWMYVREEARSWGLERDLVKFSEWLHQSLRKDVDQNRFVHVTGFVHPWGQFEAMERLWRRLWGNRMHKVGIIYFKD
jgi:hypothetical protein